MVFSDEYREGDVIILEASEENIHLVCQVDDALGSAFVYITDKCIRYTVPFGEKRICSFEKKRVSWLTVDKLIKADYLSPFPALTQIEVYGTETI